VEGVIGFSVVLGDFNSPEGLSGSFNRGFSHGKGGFIVLHRTYDVKEHDPHSPAGQALDACSCPCLGRAPAHARCLAWGTATPGFGDFQERPKPAPRPFTGPEPYETVDPQFSTSNFYFAASFAVENEKFCF